LGEINSLSVAVQIGGRVEDNHGIGPWFWPVVKFWLAPLLIAAVALILRLHHLGAKPFWLDEVATWHRATISFSSMVTESLRSKHYPAYFILAWLIGKIGATQWLLRLPSAIFGALDAALVCVIGREADQPRTGIAAGLLMALSPFDVEYGQEARSYTLVALFILVALWGLVRLARDPAVPLLRAKSQSWSWVRWPALPWLAYGGGTASALNILNVAVPWWVAANLAAIPIAYAAGAARRKFLRRWGLMQAAIFVAWLPAIVAVSIASKGGDLEGPSWAPPETWSTIWSVLAPVYLDRLSAFITFDLMPAVVPGLSLVLAAMALYGAWRLRRQPTMLAVILCAAAVLPLLLLIVARITPVLVPRYFAWGAAPFFILAGAGFARFWNGRFSATLAALVLVGLINLRPYYQEETKPRWDLAMDRLTAETQPGDVVLFNDWNAYYVATTYAAHDGLAQRGLTMTWKPSEASRATPGHDLFVVYGRAAQGTLTTSADYNGLIAQLGSPASAEQVGHYITIRHFASPNMLAFNCADGDSDNSCAAATVGKP
jgi:uncharacterized membrane protein